MRRREFITLLGGAAAWPLTARAQQSDRIPRIGILFGGFSDSDPESSARIDVFKRRLHEFGWMDGHNIKVEVRFGGGDENRRRTYATELISMTPDVIVANSAPAVITLARQTNKIPIVFTNVFDPVGIGLVASLGRPGGNITGFSNFGPAMVGKWLELLHEIAPSVTHVTAIFERTFNVEFARMTESLAPSFHLQYATAPISNVTDVKNAIGAVASEANGGLIVIGGTISATNRETIVRLTAQHRVPTIYAYRYFVTSGGLLSYGVDGVELFRGAAAYVDRILKGAKPAELPVQQPTKFELVINRKTAKALGLAVPPTLIARADEVIE